MAFDEAELLALRLPAPAARMFGYAYVAYGTSGDVAGQLLAGASRVAITGNPPDLGITLAAIDDLTASRPEVAAPFNGPAAEAGPWRYWAEFLERLRADEDRRLSVMSTISTAQRVTGRLWRAVLACADIAGVVVGVVVAYRADPAAFTIGVGSLLGLLLVAVAVTGNWRLPSVLRVGDGRGVGAFPPATLGFTALIGGKLPGRDRVYLWAHVRPLGFASRRQWVPLALMALVAGLAAPFRRDRRTGYVGRWRTSLSWETDPPAADGAWWSAGKAPGVLLMSPLDASQPWERIITASLGPDTAGQRKASGTTCWRSWRWR